MNNFMCTFFLGGVTCCQVTSLGVHIAVSVLCFHVLRLGSAHCGWRYMPSSASCRTCTLHLTLRLHTPNVGRAYCGWHYMSSCAQCRVCELCVCLCVCVVRELHAFSCLVSIVKGLKTCSFLAMIYLLQIKIYLWFIFAKRQKYFCISFSFE